MLFFMFYGIIQPLNGKGEGNMKNKEIRKLVFSIISVSLFLIVATTFVYIPKQENLLSSLAFLKNEKRFYMQDLSSGVLLKEAIPTSDNEGMKNDPYIFKITNNSSSKITYQIVFKNDKEKIEKMGKEVLPNKYLRYSIKENNDNFIEPVNLTDDGIIYETVIDAKSSTVFEFKMWLDYNSDNGAMNKSFVGKIGIEEVK